MAGSAEFEACVAEELGDGSDVEAEDSFGVFGGEEAFCEAGEEDAEVGLA